MINFSFHNPFRFLVELWQESQKSLPVIIIGVFIVVFLQKNFPNQNIFSDQFVCQHNTTSGRTHAEKFYPTPSLTLFENPQPCASTGTTSATKFNFHVHKDKVQTAHHRQPHFHSQFSQTPSQQPFLHPINYQQQSSHSSVVMGGPLERNRLDETRHCQHRISHPWILVSEYCSRTNCQVRYFYAI